MRFDHLYIASLGSWLPSAIPVATAVARGACSSETAVRSGMESVTVCDDTTEAPAEMAVRAAATALRRAGTNGADVGLLLHSSLYDQGNALWGTASYVQRRAVRSTCPAMEIRQVSNGGMAALTLAGSYLAAVPTATEALVTTADRFCPPGFDRWRSDPGTVYADGGTAMLLSRRDGFARVRSLAMVSDPELEGMHRVGDAFGTAEVTPPGVLDLDSCRRSYVDRAGMSFSVARVASGQRDAVKWALAGADVELADIARFVLPHFGRRRLETNCLRPLGIGPERTTWEFSRRVGHLGAGDQAASLEHLTLSGALRPGDLCLLMGIGAGFTWSCAVVEVMRAPGGWTA
ncbi:ketoacyl-ACP synthase III family protein [Streptomyces sp. SM11]|uniref:ketoacyl-ACP synthase III family protein n=1 Tax=Streptomyces sp. SM11 TaxID=565557 RepID=UPI000CD522DC|nr:ketoacyl-ACP synthase III family protein [Streptomyces sp. SM11]